MSTLDPAQLLLALSTKARPQKKHHLEVIQQVCAELHRLGRMDFSLATIGRISEERGGISRRTLYNSASHEYKTLIRSWIEFSKHNSKPTIGRKSRETPQVDSDLLMKIDDPALRTLMGYIIAERDRMRSEVKLLRSHANVVVDRRVLPGHINVTPEGQVIHIMSSAGLSDTEKQALSRAISSEFLAQEGWSEGLNGEILNSHGRKLFDIGFANAVRKILI